jgi:potassium-transporting ATPase potassium-binding subunit
MSGTAAGVLFLALLVGALAVVHVPLGDYMFRVYSSKKHSRTERFIYRLIGANPEAEQTWVTYARSMLAFSAVSVVFLFVLQLVQGKLPLHLHNPGTPMTPALAWNTAVSFVTNTNWQNYSGESTDGHLVQMAGFAVQNFVSAAVGIAVAIALVRGFARSRTGELGNFWVDLTRGTLRILLPISVFAAIVLIAGGAVQNFHLNDQVVNTLAGTPQTIPGGPVASQEAIKEFGTNGGGFYNANSSHPFENPTSWTNWIEIFLLLVISFSLPRTFGRMVDSKKQGYAIAAIVGIMAGLSVTFMMFFQLQHHGTVPTAVGAATEGAEQRFGVADSAVFADATTLTSTGAIDSVHDSYTSLGGMMQLFNMQLGEVAPGGTGSGLYGILILAVITVFVAGLMVGRTPEYLGKKITPREMKLAAGYFLITPLIALLGTAIAMALPGERAAMANSGPHGLSEVLYAFTSAANNNGSAFAGLSGNTVWWNTALGLAMAFGRFLPMILVLALAGSLARQGMTPESSGTLPTHKPQFIGLVVGVTVILVALTFLPALALGPLAEGIH